MTAPDSPIEFDEFMVLSECALRFDGYEWCEANALDSGELMNGYWDASTHDALLAKPVEYQMAVFFLQQRSFRWNSEVPVGDMLQLWRRLFLALAPLAVPAQFASGHGSANPNVPDGSPLQFWLRLQAVYGPMAAAPNAAGQTPEVTARTQLAALGHAIAARLAADTPLDEPLVIEGEP